MGKNIQYKSNKNIARKYKSHNNRIEMQWERHKEFNKRNNQNERNVNEKAEQFAMHELLIIEIFFVRCRHFGHSYLFHSVIRFILFCILQKTANAMPAAKCTHCLVFCVVWIDIEFQTECHFLDKNAIGMACLWFRPHNFDWKFLFPKCCHHLKLTKLSVNIKQLCHFRSTCVTWNVFLTFQCLRCFFSDVSVGHSFRYCIYNRK